MKQLDLSKSGKQKASDESMQKVQGAFADALSRIGITVEGEEQAREAVTRLFGRLLDNRYSMLENVSLPNLAEAIPLVLIGPPGIIVINPRNDTGVFRAREDTWVMLNQRSQKYEETRENPMVQTQDYAQAVEAFLQEKGVSPVEVQPVLILVNPGAHVESSRPIVRILPVDAQERYLAALVQAPNPLSAPDVQALVEVFTTQPVEPVAPQPEPQPQPEKAPPPFSSQVELPPFLANFKLSKQQWILLVVMAVFEIILLIVLVFIILLNA
jgi:hypothetical protein